MLRPLLAAVERLVDALADARRREAIVILLLIAHVAIWTLYAVVSTAGRDVHFDMLEAAVLARDPAAGYPKHPPMSIWLAGLWFSVFPLAGWAYYLLAFTMPAIALWVAWRLSERWLDAERRVLGLALLTLIPFFNFHSLKYNANTVLIPFWALTAWAFVRAFEHRARSAAALAGLAAAGAMLGKYWSIFLVAGLGLAALVDRRRAAYFRSPAPWITVAVGFAALAPHLYWLATHDFLSIRYGAHRAAGEASFASALVEAAKYLAGVLGYVAVPTALALIAGRASRAALADILVPATTERRFAALLFWGPLLVPVAFAVPAGIHINSLWSMPSYTLFAVVLLSAPLLVVRRAATVAIVAFALAVPLAALIASPLVAVATHYLRPQPVDFAALAAAVEREWRQTSPQPLRIVGAAGDVVYGIAFHMRDRPSAFTDLSPQAAPWIDEARIAREGMAAVCASADQSCVTRADGWAARDPRTRRTEVEVARPWPGAGADRYRVVALPPRS